MVFLGEKFPPNRPICFTLLFAYYRLRVSGRFRFVRCKPLLLLMNRAIRKGIGYRGIKDEKKALSVDSALVGADSSARQNHPTEPTLKASSLTIIFYRAYHSPYYVYYFTILNNRFQQYVDFIKTYAKKNQDGLVLGLSC